ncbi:hypothetical protein [Sulfitobacter guttiformis]|uniref:Uncharacterized protein n=1 Tax=Sulfitobacter guttiformis TaxID=74349 RepID=A0A420DMS9_9RHOB|nr:hypothetical protein [Sulfitobacter guttiformis]KIN72864.1 hypothetical protein Z949_2045 [Sulfitobacter guttiformis KCTC 32187]RKE95553.1 hypothetical protein C8N30_0089 [Sulfitobacter guttiformis]
MKNLVLSTTAVIALMGSAAFAQTTSVVPASTVSLIEVTTDLEAIQNAEAAEVWVNIDADLALAIEARFAERMAAEGAEIIIDIDEVSLATSFEQAIGSEESYLQGDILYRVPGPDNNASYTLKVSSLQAQAFYPDGTSISDITQGSDIYYAAMIDAFADNVVRNLDASQEELATE